MPFCTIGRHRLNALMLVLLALAGAGAARAGDSLSFWVDHACFKHLDDPQKTYVEVYVTIDRRQLTFQPYEGKFKAIGSFFLSITDSTGQQIDSVGFHVASSVADPAEAQREHFGVPAVFGFVLKPGNYRAALEVVDRLSKKSGERSFPLVVPSFAADSLSLSEIELATKTSAAELGVTDTLVGMFQKNGLVVIPNPAGTCARQDKKLSFYAEAYGFTQTQPEYLLQVAVLDTQGLVVKDYGQKAFAKPGSTAVLASSIPIDSLPEGKYLLDLTVVDRATGQVAEQRKRFTVVGAVTLPQTLTFADSGAFREEEAKAAKSLISYLATPEELLQYDRLPLGEKYSFIQNFWKKRDPDPNTRINEFLTEYYRRFLYANANFSADLKEKKDGWKTDLGRVYMVYGPPNDIERGYMASDQAAWERWQYSSLPGQGGVYFLFVEEHDTGRWRLVDSTARREIHDPRWEERIQTERLQP